MAKQGNQVVSEADMLLARYDAAKGSVTSHQGKYLYDRKGNKVSMEDIDELDNNEVVDNKNDEDTPQNAPEENLDTHVVEDSKANEDNQPPVDNVSDDGHDWKKRYGDQQTYVNQLKGEISDLKKELEAASTIDTLSKEDLQELKQDRPELYKTIISIAKEAVAKESNEVKERLENLDARQRELLQKEAMAEIRKVHTDADKIQSSQDFATWFGAQSPGIQKLFVEGATVQDIIQGLNVYKLDKGITTKTSKQEKEDKAAAAEGVDSSKGKSGNSGDGQKDAKIWYASEIAKMSETEYLKYEKEIDKAVAEGRFRNNA